MAETKADLKDARAKDAKAKDAALGAAVTQIERQFGAGSVMKLGDQAAIEVEAIATGGLSLDLALGVGGVPRGRIVEIFGPESSGKTTLIYHIIAEAQARGGVCAFVDAEHAIDPLYAKRNGGNTDELLISQPDYGEKANQIREKIGVMFGSPETQPGGRALKFYCSQRLDLRRIETLKEGTEAVGNRVRVKVVKNKVAAPFRLAEFDIEYGVGISKEGCVLDLGIEHGIVQKSGSFFSYGDERLGQGRNNVKGYLRENPQVAQEIERKIYDALGVDPASPFGVVETPPVGDVA